MKGHVTIEYTKKSIKIQMLLSVIAIIVGVLALIGDSNVGFLFIGIGIAWDVVFIPLQKWWHHS